MAFVVTNGERSGVSDAGSHDEAYRREIVRIVRAKTYRSVSPERYVADDRPVVSLLTFRGASDETGNLSNIQAYISSGSVPGSSFGGRRTRTLLCDAAYDEEVAGCSSDRSP